MLEPQDLGVIWHGYLNLHVCALAVDSKCSLHTSVCTMVGILLPAQHQPLCLWLKDSTHIQPSIAAQNHQLTTTRAHSNTPAATLSYQTPPIGKHINIEAHHLLPPPPQNPCPNLLFSFLFLSSLLFSFLLFPSLLFSPLPFSSLLLSSLLFSSLLFPLLIPLLFPLPFLLPFPPLFPGATKPEDHQTLGSK